MNVVIPKTLAEPLTIPWFTREAIDISIKRAIFEHYMKIRVGLGITVEQMLSAMEHEAIRNGATMTSTAYSKLMHSDRGNLTLVGWQYRVYFSVTGNDSLYVEVIDGWFPGKSYLANKKYRIYRADSGLPRRVT